MLKQPRHTVGPDEVHVWHLLADRRERLPIGMHPSEPGAPARQAGAALAGASGSDATQSRNAPGDPAMVDALRLLLSANEQARLAGFRLERDRTLFLLSRALMRTVLASYVGCATSEVCFGANDFGKPILQSAPVARGGSGIHFNLTHSRGAAVLAVSNREVGVDVEERLRKVEYLALAERFFAVSEWRHLETLPADELPAAFFAIWTLKEAYVKGIGRGLSFPLDAFCFDLEGNRLLRFRPLTEFVSTDWHFHQFDLSDRHCGAVAVKGGAAHVEMRDWQSVFL